MTRAYKANARTSLRRPGRAHPTSVNGDLSLPKFVFLPFTFNASSAPITRQTSLKFIQRQKRMFFLLFAEVFAPRKRQLLFLHTFKRTELSLFKKTSVCL